MFGHTLHEEITTVAQLMHKRMMEGSKVMICGNGGSATDAMHFAAELVVRYAKNREPLSAMALTADQAILTACANDFSFNHVFERQVAALGQSGDVLICISTSGNSPNVVHAAQCAQNMGITVVGMTGVMQCKLHAHSDLTLNVPATETALVQTLHQIVYHSICEVIDDLCH